jgi:entericidin A
MKNFFTMLICILFFTGCNTVQGFGKDVKKAGEAVEGAAKK